MNQRVDFDGIRVAFQNGEIHSATSDELEGAVAALANTRILNDSVRHEATIMADAIHSILLRRLLDTQERRNQKAQFWFLVLAGAGVLSALVQILIASVEKWERSANKALYTINGERTRRFLPFRIAGFREALMAKSRVAMRSALASYSRWIAGKSDPRLPSR